MGNESSSDRNETIREGILEYQEGRKNTKRAEIWIYAINYTHEFCRSHLIVETKILILSDTQDNNV